MRAYAILVPFFTVLIGGSIWVKTERDPDRYQRKAKSEAVRETELQAVRALLAIDDPESRARAIFGEVSKVFTHPRCANCHTADVPLQGETGSPHRPMVAVVNGGAGAPGMLCVTCHGTESYLNVPGAPGWVMAPEGLAWSGRSAAEICTALKEERPGLDDVIAYLRSNPMVDYGWRSPEHLTAAPGNKDALIELFEA